MKVMIDFYSVTTPKREDTLNSKKTTGQIIFWLKGIVLNNSERSLIVPNFSFFTILLYPNILQLDLNIIFTEVFVTLLLPRNFFLFVIFLISFFFKIILWLFLKIVAKSHQDKFELTDCALLSAGLSEHHRFSGMEVGWFARVYSLKNDKKSANCECSLTLGNYQLNIQWYDKKLL